VNIETQQVEDYAVNLAFNAGVVHARRTDLPKGHNALKFASDRYPNPSQDRLFEAFMQGWDATRGGS
jgi:hypothetical protein